MGNMDLFRDCSSRQKTQSRNRVVTGIMMLNLLVTMEYEIDVAIFDNDLYLCMKKHRNETKLLFIPSK